MEPVELAGSEAVRAAPPSALPDETGKRLAGIAAGACLSRIGIVAWRDVDDAEAGGSELHAHEIARRWSAAGIDVVCRTSKVHGAARVAVREGYRVDRRAGRYAVFAAAPFDVRRGRYGRLDALVEIWNGMPFLSPLWFKGPRVVFLHHVHAEMWQMVLPPRLAATGRFFEARVAPPLYRGTAVVTLSRSSRDEIVETLGLEPSLVYVVPPGIDARFSPGGKPSDHPLIAAVGRLVPVKQFERLARVAALLRPRHADLEVVIAGEGYERRLLDDAIGALGLRGTVRLAGRIEDDALVELYRRAWVLVSVSAREGWGMTITEAAACGTPAVASRIPGHVDAVEEGGTGLLFSSDAELASRLDLVLSDTLLRRRLAKGAEERARSFTWDAAAEGTLLVVAEAAERARRAHRARSSRRRPGR